MDANFKLLTKYIHEQQIVISRIQSVESLT